MAYDKNSLTTIEQIKTLYELLTLSLATLNTRIDTDITAGTEDSEVIDARLDAWNTVNSSLGSNIRSGQSRLALGLKLLQESHQTQLDEIAEAQIDLATIIPRFITKRSQELSTEEESRVVDDNSLQNQIQLDSRGQKRFSKHVLARTTYFHTANIS